MGLGKKVRISKIKASGISEELDDLIPDEKLLAIYLNGNKVVTLSCSPASEIELAAGYLVSSGYVDSVKKIQTINHCDEDAEKSLTDRIEVKTDGDNSMQQKNDFISSGCGNIDDFILENKIDKINSHIKISSDILLDLGKKTIKSQRLKKAFGGLHSGVFFDLSGKIVVSREDIGRHNCLDKVIGYCLLKKLDLSKGIIYTTGRVSFDVILKLASVNICCLVTNSSVTEKAVKIAKRLDMTLIGYARGNRFNIYYDDCRINIVKKS